MYLWSAVKSLLNHIFYTLIGFGVPRSRIPGVNQGLARGKSITNPRSYYLLIGDCKDPAESWDKIGNGSNFWICKIGPWSMFSCTRIATPLLCTKFKHYDSDLLVLVVIATATSWSHNNFIKNGFDKVLKSTLICWVLIHTAEMSSPKISNELYA